MLFAASGCEGAAGMVVTRLATTPIKGLRMNEPQEVLLDSTGAVGDRDFMLIDERQKLRSITVNGGLARLQAKWDPVSLALEVTDQDGVTCAGVVRLGDPVLVNTFADQFRPSREVLGPWAAFISETAGENLRLVKTDAAGGASDVAPVTLMGQGSVDELGRRSGLAGIDPRRFRMLIEFGPSAPHIEDSWEKRTLDIGSAQLTVGGPVPRCAATTRDPESGVRDMPIVRAIRDYRGIQETPAGRGVPFGVYAEVLRAGRVRVGDSLRLSEEALCS